MNWIFLSCHKKVWFALTLLSSYNDVLSEKYMVYRYFLVATGDNLEFSSKFDPRILLKISIFLQILPNFFAFDDFFALFSSEIASKTLLVIRFAKKCFCKWNFFDKMPIFGQYGRKLKFLIFQTSRNSSKWPKKAKNKEKDGSFGIFGCLTVWKTWKKCHFGISGTLGFSLFPNSSPLCTVGCRKGKMEILSFWPKKNSWDGF